MTTQRVLTTEHFKKIPGMRSARLPAQRIWRHPSENITPRRALTARRQTEDFNIRRQRPHMESPERRLKSAGGSVVKIPELVLDRQSDPGAICCLMKDQKIGEQA